MSVRATTNSTGTMPGTMVSGAAARSGSGSPGRLPGRHHKEAHGERPGSGQSVWARAAAARTSPASSSAWEGGICSLGHWQAKVSGPGGGRPHSQTWPPSGPMVLWYSSGGRAAGLRRGGASGRGRCRHCGHRRSGPPTEALRAICAGVAWWRGGRGGAGRPGRSRTRSGTRATRRSGRHGCRCAPPQRHRHHPGDHVLGSSGPGRHPRLGRRPQGWQVEETHHRGGPGQTGTARPAASRTRPASISTRDSGIPRAGHSTTKASGPGGGRP